MAAARRLTSRNMEEEEIPSEKQVDYTTVHVKEISILVDIPLFSTGERDGSSTLLVVDLSSWLETGKPSAAVPVAMTDLRLASLLVSFSVL